MNFAGTPELMVASLLLLWATQGTVVTKPVEGCIPKKPAAGPPWNFLRCRLIIPFLSYSQAHGGPQDQGDVGCDNREVNVSFSGVGTG